MLLLGLGSNLSSSFGDRFKNIEDGLVPWRYSTGSKYTSAGPKAIDVEEAVALCQKAYYNFAVL